MKTLLCALLIFPTSVLALTRQPTPPNIEYCVLSNETYACIRTVMGGTTYLAIFAKDGKSLIRVYEITHKGKQRVIYSE